MPPVSPRPHGPSRALITTAIVTGIIALIVLVAWYALPLLRSALQGTPSSFTAVFNEGGAYQWYQFSAGGAAPIAAPKGLSPQVARYQSNGVARVDGTGLSFTDALGASLSIIDRAEPLPDSRALASDGSVAALYNETTNALDIFLVENGGLSASYAGSVPVPPKFVAVGAGEGGVIVIETGSPTTFTLYGVSRAGVRPAGTALLTSSQ